VFGDIRDVLVVFCLLVGIIAIDLDLDHVEIIDRLSYKLRLIIILFNKIIQELQ